MKLNMAETMTYLPKRTKEDRSREGHRTVTQWATCTVSENGKLFIIAYPERQNV